MEIKNITKKYQLKRKEITILENISYKFKKGKFYMINGESGTGKTTLANILGLMLKPTDGAYYFDKEEVSKLNDIKLSEIRRRKIGFVFQDYNLDNHLKAYENVMLPLLLDKSLNNKDRKEKAIDMLSSLGLKERVNHYPKELSGGECERVAIARALINEPEYIIADEPTGNLDIKREEEVFSLLKKLAKEGKGVIVVTHSDKASKYADVMLRIKDKKLVELEDEDK